MTKLRVLESAAYLLLALVAPIVFVLFAAPLLVVTGCINAASIAIGPDWDGVVQYVLKLAALR